MSLQHSISLPRRLLRKLQPKTQRMRLCQRDASKELCPKQTLREIVKHFTTGLVPSFLRNGKNDCNKQNQDTARSNDKFSQFLQQIECSELLPKIPAASFERLKLPFQIIAIPFDDSDNSSASSGSEKSMGCSTSSTKSSEVDSEASPEPHRTEVTIPEQSIRTDLTEREQHERDFAFLRAIPDEVLISQLLIHVNQFNYWTPKHCRIQRRTEGANHHVVIVQIGPKNLGMEYVIKMPVTGTKERWTEGQAYNMQCEALLMRHMAKKTNIPVPEVICFKNNLDNSLGVPYILMRKLPGKTAYHIWFDKDDHEGHDADYPSEQTMKKRETFPKSLARHMAELQELEFAQIGMLNFEEDIDDPIVGHTWQKRDGAMTKVEPNLSTRDVLLSSLGEKYPANLTLADITLDNSSDAEKAESEMYLHRALALRKILDIIFACDAFTSKSHPTTPDYETFVIRHPDLDLQNILVDNDGKVTGILDWHEATTAPRCIGFSALPYFLTHDWHPGFTLTDPPYMAWTVDHYRRIYADAMKEACTDGRYTYESAIYQAAWAAVTREGGDCEDFVNKVLLQLPGLRLTDLEEFQERLGRGWTAAEEYLEKEIPKLLAVEE